MSAPGPSIAGSKVAGACEWRTRDVCGLFDDRARTASSRHSATRCRTTAVAHPRGVAQASVLLHDPGGPVYSAFAGVTVADAATAARVAPAADADGSLAGV